MGESGRASEVEFRVRYAETDSMGFVYHTHYLVWCEVGRTHLLRETGTSYAELERTGVFLAVSEAEIRYHAPACYDDRIRVRTRLRALRSRGVVFDYEILDADSGRRLATARTHLVCLDRDARPQSLPSDLRARLGDRLGDPAADAVDSRRSTVDS
jgi:acyl-CoA thioester hydrolase